MVGIAWSFTEQLGRRGINIALTLLLARFLAPEDYGLVAMMAIFLDVSQRLMESGFKQAIIRIQGDRQTDFNTAFFANLALGSLAYSLLFLSAPYVAAFYDVPQLTILIRVAGISILIQAFQIVQLALLTRSLNFKAQTQASIPAGIISGIIAVALAYLGYGVWALILNMLLSSLLITFFLWHLQGWRPSKTVSRQALIRMYSFGYKLFLSGLLYTLSQNIYIIVIAKVLTASIAGYYFFAKKIIELIVNQLVTSIKNVTYPAMVTIRNDEIRLKTGYRKIVKVITFIMFPCVLLLAALAEPLFAFLLPPKWLPAALYLQLLCAASIMEPIHDINKNVLQVKGRSDLFLLLMIINILTSMTVLAVSYRYGIIGILVGQITSSMLNYIPNSYFAIRLINYSIREQLADFAPGLALSGIVALMVYWTGLFLQWPVFAELTTMALLSCFLYLAGAHVLRLQSYLLTRQLIFERLNRGQ